MDKKKILREILISHCRCSRKETVGVKNMSDVEKIKNEQMLLTRDSKMNSYWKLSNGWTRWSSSPYKSSNRSGAKCLHFGDLKVTKVTRNDPPQPGYATSFALYQKKKKQRGTCSQRRTIIYPGLGWLVGGRVNLCWIILCSSQFNNYSLQFYTI